MSDTATFTDRRSEQYEVATIDPGSSGDMIFIGTTESTGFGIPLTDRAKAIKVGDKVELELYRFNHIAGLRHNGEEVFPRRSNEYFEQERLKFIEDSNRRQWELYEKHKDEWAERQKNLPDWLQARLERFKENGGDEFLKAWGYELICCEIAALLEKHEGNEEHPDIQKFYDVEGVSGNQVYFGKILYGVHRDEPELGYRAPSALTPLTGNPYYRGEGVKEP